MKTMVIVHGCHLQAELRDGDATYYWKHLVWGDGDPGNPTLAGRVVKGVQIACRDSADFIAFGTGASEIDGVKEGQYAVDFALEHADALAELLGVHPGAIRGLLTECSVIDTTSQNTTEELEILVGRAIDLGVDRVTLVSSSFHIMRCHAEALKIMAKWREEGRQSLPEIMAVGAEDCTHGTMIVEPPHRGDQAQHGVLGWLPRYFKAGGEMWPVLDRNISESLREIGR